jgi:hypothetical protein
MSDAFLSLQKLSASFLNNLFKGSAGWEPYTPVWDAGGAATTLGNGSLTGAYAKSGRTTHFRIALVWGSSTSSPAGAWQFTTPNVAAAVGWVGGARILDASPAVQYYRHAFLNSSNKVALSAEAASTFVQATVPITFASGDGIYIAGTYEATS